MKFNEKNKDLRFYQFLDFLKENKVNIQCLSNSDYDKYFEFYRNNFYNPETGNKGEQEFAEWFDINNEIEISKNYFRVLENPIDIERRLRKLELGTLPINITLTSGEIVTKNFKYLLNKSKEKYGIYPYMWKKQFSFIWAEDFTIEDNENISKEELEDIKKIFSKYGKIEFCIKGNLGIIVYLKQRKKLKKKDFEKYENYFCRKYNTMIALTNTLGKI